MKNKSYNYKFIIGLIIGVLSITVVYAANNILSSSVYYDSDNSSLSSGDIQGAIDDLAINLKTTTCPEDYFCEEYKTTLELGDYVSYTPTKTSATTNTAYTGYSESQTVNPSELNLWRVLNINDDGTVDLISEYVSSVGVYFRGQTGYLNFVGELNRLASQYETEGITSGSRHFGYNGQTEFITDTSMFSAPTSWTASTSDNSNESIGGGDTLYEKDYNQASTVLGTLVALKTNNNTISSYWVASRYYGYYGVLTSKSYKWKSRYIEYIGVLSGSSSGFIDMEGYMYYYNGSSFSHSSRSSALRPIVTLKSGLTYGNGTGDSYSPIQIIS